jgi:hypothetical protein
MHMARNIPRRGIIRRGRRRDDRPGRVYLAGVWFGMHCGGASMTSRPIPNLRFTVSRYCIYLSDFRPNSGDYLQVGDIDLGEFCYLTEAEYQRAKAEYPENPAFAMRPMWFTGSAYGREILRLAESVRCRIDDCCTVGEETK